MKIVFVHGWGTDSGIWNPICKKLSHHEIYTVDLGFLNRPKLNNSVEKNSVQNKNKNYAKIHKIIQTFDTNHNLPVASPFLGIGHSLGVAWLLKHASSSLSGLISIAGFAKFSVPYTLPILEKMKKGLDRNPTAQLKLFWRSANIRLDMTDDKDHGPPFVIGNILDLNKLKAGLDYLSEGDESYYLENLTCPVRALASHDDEIVNESITRGQWTSEQLRWANTGGHGLPTSQVGWCVEQIESFVAELSEN